MYWNFHTKCKFSHLNFTRKRSYLNPGNFQWSVQFLTFAIGQWLTDILYFQLDENSILSKNIFELSRIISIFELQFHLLSFDLKVEMNEVLQRKFSQRNWNKKDLPMLYLLNAEIPSIL